jgi:hypothetical protein
VAEVATGLAAIGQLVGAAGAQPWFQDSGKAQVRAVSVPWHRPPSGAADLLRRIPETSAERPRIHVERIDGVHGRRWVVSIPGTANWSPVAGRSPFDLTGNVRLMAAQRCAAMTGVVAAMRELGVQKGEPVLLAGYSQGGIVAAAVAADPSVRREFTVSHVLTSAAPVASVPIPADIQVLSLEHSDDLVPRLDGSPNRDRPNWTTVTAPASTADLPPTERNEPFAAHRAEAYQGTADRVDESTHPSIALWRSSIAPFASGSGVGWDVELSRAGTP